MPLTSCWRDVAIPNTDLWTFYMEEPRDFPDEHRLLIDGDKPENGYSLGELRSLSRSLGRGLGEHMGLQKGDTLASYTPNSIDMPLVSMAALWGGLVFAPANPTYTADELAKQLVDSEAKVLVTQTAQLGVACEAADKAGLGRGAVVLLGYARQQGFRHWRDLLVQGEGPRPCIEPDTDVACLMYSSGTTGLPKGVMLTHANLIANSEQAYKVETRNLLWDTDVQLGFLPLFHLYGFSVVLNATFRSGAPCIILANYNIERVCRLIEHYRVTLLYVVPPVILALSRHPAAAKYDVSSLRWITSGAAPLSRSLVTDVWARMSVGVKQAYGLSETSPTVTMLLPDEWWRFHGSVGRLMPNMQAKIVDEEGNDVPCGEPGELLVKGPNVFQGYWKRPELQSEVFTPDGWFRTGDSLYTCPKGYFYIADRIKELIKYKGFQVPPAEVEAKLIEHPDIADVAVIGVWDEGQHTEIPRGYVVLRDGVEASDQRARDIVAWLADRIAPAKRLRGGVRFIRAIPKSQAGKILRRDLRQLALKEHSLVVKAKL